MAAKNTAEVVIAGKVYRISGYESTEYLHQVAAYINDRQAGLQKTEGYSRQSGDQRQLLLNMNLADDYFKTKTQAEQAREELETKERELYSVRHDLIESQLALEKTGKEHAEQKKKLEQELRSAREQQKKLEQENHALRDQQKKLEQENRSLKEQVRRQKP